MHQGLLSLFSIFCFEQPTEGFVCMLIKLIQKEVSAVNGLNKHWGIWQGLRDEVKSQLGGTLLLQLAFTAKEWKGEKKVEVRKKKSFDLKYKETRIFKRIYVKLLSIIFFFLHQAIKLFYSPEHSCKLEIGCLGLTLCGSLLLQSHPPLKQASWHWQWNRNCLCVSFNTELRFSAVYLVA